MMPSAPATRNSARSKKAVGVLVLALSLAWLSGCQGFSTAVSNLIGDLSFANGGVNFGNVAAGSSTTLSVNATNSGTAALTISSVTISSKYFTLVSPTLPFTMAVGQNTTFSVKFSPNAAGPYSATAAVTSNASNAQTTLSLSGTGTGTSTGSGQLSASPSSYDFGSVAVGSQQSQTITLTNTGTATVNISQAAASGTGFAISGITPPLALGVSQNTSFTVTFAPQSAGAVSGSVTITSDASNSPLTIALSGTGTAVAGQLSVTPTTLDLGSVVDGTSGTASGTLTASGASVTVTAASTNNSVFTVGGLSLPVTIAAGKTASFTVTFSPQTSGAASATLTFTSNASPGTTTESLTGTGTAAPSHTVSLSWNASTSSDISGYNIYRAPYTTSCGSFGKINPTLNTTTLYTDSGVVDGQSYCYAATTVNTSNEESGYSNIVPNVKIPPP